MNDEVKFERNLKISFKPVGLCLKIELGTNPPQGEGMTINIMKLSEKLEVLIRRNGMKKTEFAEKIGITYRALANYISGTREPKKSVLLKIAETLDTDMVFLTDNAKSLTLTSEERFYFGATSEGRGILDAMFYLDKSRELFAGEKLSEDDKQALFNCVTEIYFAAKNKKRD